MSKATDAWDILADKETWHDGPLFEAEIRLAQARLRDLPVETAQSILPYLGIDGGYADIEHIGDPLLRIVDWRQLPLSYGHWHLDENTVVGVLILPALPHHACLDLVVSVPPAHIAHEFGEFPWFTLDEEVTEEVMRLHRLVLGHLKNLHDHLPVLAALARDEGWTFSLDANWRGALVAKEIGLALGLKGEVQDDLYCVPLFEPGHSQHH